VETTKLPPPLACTSTFFLLSFAKTIDPSRQLLTIVFFCVIRRNVIVYSTKFCHNHLIINHENHENHEYLRLSYHDKNHYDSVRNAGNVADADVDNISVPLDSTIDGLPLESTMEAGRFYHVLKQIDATTGKVVACYSSFVEAEKALNCSRKLIASMVYGKLHVGEVLQHVKKVPTFRRQLRH
jgi:hypothetical protein